MSCLPSSTESAAPRSQGPSRSVSEPPVAAIARSLWLAIHGLVRTPRHSVPALISLALGLGASTAVFAVFSALLLRPLPFPEEARLVQVGFAGASAQRSPTDLLLSAPFLRDFQQLTSIFEQVATDHSWTARLEVNGRVLRAAPEFVSPNFFDTLRVQALEGRLFSAHGVPDDNHVVVLREGFWRHQLGGEPLVGKTVLYEGQPLKVLGIVRDEQAIPLMDLWIPEDQTNDQRRMFFRGRGIARLANGVNLEDARARLAEATKDAGVVSTTGAPISAQMRPLRDSLIQPQRSWVALMLVAVGAFLLLAAANLAALLATRSTARAHEWAVRRALGSSSGALARQSALDAGLLAVTGAALGLLLAQVAIEFANRTYQDALCNTPARLDARVYAACGLATLLCTVAGALAPALSRARVQPADVLRAEGRSTDTRRARRLREVLLVVQVAVTSVLLLNAGILIRSVRSLLAVDTGFETRSVVAENLLLPIEPLPTGLELGPLFAVIQQRSDTVVNQARSAVERLRALDGVQHATVTVDVPFDIFSWATRWQSASATSDCSAEVGAAEGCQAAAAVAAAGGVAAGAEPTAGSAPKELMAFRHYVGPGYFQTFGIPIVSGTDFGDTFVAADRPVAVVSRAFARGLGVQDAVGQRFHATPAGVAGVSPRPTSGVPDPNRTYEVIGMVEDSIESDLSAPAQPQVYLPFAAGSLAVWSASATVFHVAARGLNADELVRDLPRVLPEVLPDAGLHPARKMGDLIGDSFWQRSALSQVLSALAAAAVALSAIGLFGITSFAVAQRTAEVGIRRALGATRRAVVQQVLCESAAVVCAGVALGAVLSWFARNLLATFLFGVTALDALTCTCVALGIGLVALLSSLLPALSASRVPPARALVGHTFAER
jgi:putative ABC transport system permease protein